MMFAIARRFIVISAVAAMLFSGPTASHACWLFGGCRPKTTYRPVYTAPACNPCQPQTVRYVPQTAYRPVCQSVPVTSYRPVTSCDPCTGCPVTCMRPVTSYVQRVSYVPYTTYRPVVATTAYAYPTVGCATGGCGTTGVTYAAPGATSTSSCCTPNYTPAPSTAPVTSPATSPATSAPATEPQPSIAPDQQVPQGGTPSTFQRPATGVESAPPVTTPASDATTTHGGALQPPYYPPPPETTKPAATAQPQLVDPRDRTAATPIAGPRLRRPLFTALATDASDRSTTVAATATLPAVPANVPAATASPAAQAQLDAAGWRAARR